MNSLMVRLARHATVLRATLACRRGVTAAEYSVLAVALVGVVGTSVMSLQRSTEDSFATIGTQISASQAMLGASGGGGGGGGGSAGGGSSGGAGGVPTGGGTSGGADSGTGGAGGGTTPGGTTPGGTTSGGTDQGGATGGGTSAGGGTTPDPECTTGNGKGQGKCKKT